MKPHKVARRKQIIHCMVVEENFHEKWRSVKVGLNMCIISSIKKNSVHILGEKNNAVFFFYFSFMEIQAYALSNPASEISIIRIKFGHFVKCTQMLVL